MGIQGTAGRGGALRRATPAWTRWTLVLVLVLAGVGTGLAVALPDRDPVGTTGSGGPAEAAPAAVVDGPGPVVSLTFNGASGEHYRFVRPLLRRHDLNATFYVAPGRVDRGEGCCMSWQQLRELYAEGDEIGGFGLDHVDLTVPHSEVEAEDHAYKTQQICAGRQRLADHDLDPRSFAYPGGAAGYEFASLGQSLPDLVAACGYESARIVGGLAAEGEQASLAVPPEQPFQIATPPEDGSAPLELADLQRPVLAAGQSEGRWVPLALDAVCDGADAGYDECMDSWRPVDAEVLDAFLAWLRDAGRPEGAPAGTRVQTVRQVMGAPPQPPLPTAQTLVSLTFTDGHSDLFDRARPLLRRHELNATFYVAPGRVDRGEGCCMTWQQLRQLYGEGDEIGGTGLDDVDLTVPHSPDEDVDHAYKRGQICHGRQRLADHGLDPRSFAYPAGAAEYVFASRQQSLADLVAACGYESARIVGGLGSAGADASIALPPEQPYLLGTPAGDGPGPLELVDLQRSVLAAGEVAGRWVPLTFNAVCHRGDPGYDACMASWHPVDDEVLDTFLAWLRHAGEPGGAPAGTSVQTVRQAMGAPPQPPLPALRTLVSLTFDDGDTTQAVAADLMRARGMRGTIFVNSGLVDSGNPYVLTWEQLAELEAQGHEIGGHTRDHVDLTDSALSEAQKREQVCGDRDRLLQKGLDARSFAYPYGGVDPATMELVRSCGYTAARSAGGVSGIEPPYAESLPPVQPFATVAVDGPGEGAGEAAELLTFESMRSAVLTAEGNGGGWVQFVLHRVCSRGSLDFAECMQSEAPIDDGTFTSFLDWLQDGAPEATSVVTVQQAMAAVG